MKSEKELMIVIEILSCATALLLLMDFVDVLSFS